MTGMTTVNFWRVVNQKNEKKDFNFYIVVYYSPSFCN